MKISKLFHWLYAFLMFLPILFLVPTLAYFGFNENATAQEYSKSVTTYYQTNEVENNDLNDLVVGNVYRFEFTNSADGQVYCDMITLVDSPTPYDVVSAGGNPYKYFRLFGPGSARMEIALGDGFIYFYTNLNSFDVVLDFVLAEVEPNTILANVYQCPIEYASGTELRWYTMGITDSVNQAINDIFDLPMFSWTSDNFISAPFNYITDLFGLPNGNVINKYLDYWLSISVIYLCFDVLMYVPLLVHRWIDKARLD